MQGIVAPASQLPVHTDQVLNSADFAGEDDLITIHTHFLSSERGVNRGRNQSLVHDLPGIPRLTSAAVHIHQVGKQLLIKTPPVHANAHRLIPPHGGLDHLTKLTIPLFTFAHVTWIDPVLGQCFGTCRKICEKLVAVVVKVSYQRDVFPHAVELFTNIGNRRCCLWRIHGDTNEL